MQKLKLALLCAASIITSNAFSMTEVSFGLSGYDVDLPPQEEVALRNPFFFNLTAKCALLFSEESSEGAISVTLKSRTAMVNDTVLDKDNNNLVFSIRHGDVFRITAASGAEVALKNQSADAIKASCSAG